MGCTGLVGQTPSSHRLQPLTPSGGQRRRWTPDRRGNITSGFRRKRAMARSGPVSTRTAQVQDREAQSELPRHCHHRSGGADHHHRHLRNVGAPDAAHFPPRQHFLPAMAAKPAASRKGSRMREVLGRTRRGDVCTHHVVLRSDRAVSGAPSGCDNRQRGHRGPGYGEFTTWVRASSGTRRESVDPGTHTTDAIHTHPDHNRSG